MTNQGKEQLIDKRLIEDYLPIEAISAEARREKSVRQGHISTLHLWWARRPLVACRAAVFGALVPARSATPEFVTDLCTYPGKRQEIERAQRLILQAHAERLTTERGEKITVEDIEAGRAPRPRVLDMFAGGGAIPLEALRLGCEAYALDLNPVAHLIELCTLVYPEKFGKPDPTQTGSAKDGTWAGLPAEVEYWGGWVLESVKNEIGDLYPPIPVAKSISQIGAGLKRDRAIRESDGQYVMSKDMMPGGLDDAEMLTPVAYLWTRTVRCKNPTCGGIVPLVRQTWLAKKANWCVALKMDAETNRNKTTGEKKVRFRVVEASTEKGLGFDPADLSKGGNATCPFCGTVANTEYVKEEGKGKRVSSQIMAIVCTRPATSGKIYISGDDLPLGLVPYDLSIGLRIQNLTNESGLMPPDEPLPVQGALGFRIQAYGMNMWRDLFTARQLLALMTLSKYIKSAHKQILQSGVNQERAKAIALSLAIATSKMSMRLTNVSLWNVQGEKIEFPFSRGAVPMTWNFPETNIFGDASGSASGALQGVVDVLKQLSNLDRTADVKRGAAQSLPYSDNEFDAVVTDPPYYDNFGYADLSDFSYVWFKRSVGHLFAEHLSSQLTPKKQEAIAESTRHEKNAKRARQAYEEMMAVAFQQARRVLKPNGPLIIVYAHKTTAGWATLVDALRKAGFVIAEAWPLDTEMAAGLRSLRASLASSIFLVARRREGDKTGSYENDVQPELHLVVRERIETLWGKGVTGADLVIACVGAGLRAFTRFAHVEYENGEEMPADKFLAEVEGVVLETLLEKLFGMPRSGLSVVDPITRFYVLWRFAYRSAHINAGEAIVFAYPQGVELDGPHSLSQGGRALLERQKDTFRLRDFTERGDNDKLGLPPDGGAAPLIDILHRTLWLMENEPRKLAEFLGEARPNIDHLRVVAETLAGAKLAGNGSGSGRSLIASRGEEAAALRKLTTNWRTLVEANANPLI